MTNADGWEPACFANLRLRHPTFAAPSLSGGTAGRSGHCNAHITSPIGRLLVPYLSYSMVELTDFKPEHFSTLASWLSSERDMVQWGGPDLTYPLSTSQLDHMMNEGRTTPPARLCWMAVDASQAVIGHVQLALDWKNGVARIGRAIIAPGMRGQGHAPALIKAVVANAFSFETIERTELNVYNWNTAAVRTYEKTGFSHEGTRRSSVRVGEERWDTIIMGMLRTEWQRTIESRSSLR